MGEKQKYIFWNNVGILGLITAMILEVMGKGTLLISFYVTLSAYGISILAKVLMNDYADKEQYNLVNLLFISNNIELFILTFYLYIRMIQSGPFQIGAVIFLVSILDLIRMLVVTTMPHYYQENKLNIYHLAIIIVACSLVSTWIPNLYIARSCKIIYILNLAISSIAYLRWRRWENKIFTNKIAYCRLYLLFSMLQFLVMVVMNAIWNKYDLILAVFMMIQAIYLLIHIYMNCLEEPWKRKTEALSKVEDILGRQRETSDTIISLSHELKTPVNVVRSALDLLILEYKSNESIVGEIREARKDCNQIINMVQNMIDIQKITGHYVEFSMQTFNLVEAIENVVDVFSEAMEESPFVFDPKEEEIYQEIDLNLLQQGFILLFGLLIKQGLEDQIYIELGKIDKTGKIYLIIQHEQVKILKEVSSQINEEVKPKSNVADLLTLQLVELIFKVHKAEIYYEVNQEKPEMEIFFPKCLSKTNKWIEAENLNVLRDQMKVRGIVG